MGLRWELRGKEHLEKDRACIIVANHQSSLDILGMFDLWPVMDKCTIVAKKELFYAWPFGLSAWLCGLIFIDRMNSEKSRSVLNLAAEQLKQEKVTLPLFPLYPPLSFSFFFFFLSFFVTRVDYYRSPSLTQSRCFAGEAMDIPRRHQAKHW